MISCPACGGELKRGAERCVCGADVSLLRELDGAINAWFNAGLDAANSGNLGRAVEWFGACRAARPFDIENLVILAKLWIRLGRPGEALDALSRADELEPETPERSELRRAAGAVDMLGDPASSKNSRIEAGGLGATLPPGALDSPKPSPSPDSTE